MEDTDGSGETLLVLPSLSAHDLEGRVHRYEGTLARRTTKARVKVWKRRWTRVAPGECVRAIQPNFLRHACRSPDHLH